MDELEKQCREFVDTHQDEIPGFVGYLLAGLLFECKEWNASGHQNKKDIEKELGNAVVALMLAKMYFNANPAVIENSAKSALEDI